MSAMIPSSTHGYMRQDCALVAFDPGASTGWRVLRFDGDSTAPVEDDHGQATPQEAADEVIKRLGSRPVGLLVIEEPFHIGIGNQWKLAWVAGELRGRLARWQITQQALWTPKQQTWRSLLGLQKSARLAKQPINEHIHEWAEHRARRPLRTITGAPATDHANAYALAEAALAGMRKQHQ